MKNNIIVERIKAKKIKKGDMLWNISSFDKVFAVQHSKYESEETTIDWEEGFGGDVVPGDAIYLRLKNNNL